MLEDRTLHHIINHRLEAEEYDDIEERLFRKALQRLKKSTDTCTYFHYLPQALHILGHPMSKDLQDEWVSMSSSTADHPQTPLSLQIKTHFATQLKEQFFITLLLKTLEWQQDKLRYTLLQTNDKDIQCYHLMSYLKQIEQHLTNNQEKTSPQYTLIRQAYNMLLAHRWLKLYVSFYMLTVTPSLMYSKEETWAILTPDNDPQEPCLPQLGNLLMKDINEETQEEEKKEETEDLTLKLLYEKMTPTAANQEMALSEYISAKEAAKILGKETSTIHRYYREGKLKNRKEEKKTYQYRRDEVEALLAQNNK